MIIIIGDKFNGKEGKAAMEKEKRITLRLDNQLYDVLLQNAKKNHMSISAYVRNELCERESFINKMVTGRNEQMLNTQKMKEIRCTLILLQHDIESIHRGGKTKYLIGKMQMEVENIWDILN